MMEQLPDSTVRLLGSTQVITSVFSVVKELFENALDAGATSIEVKLDNYGLDKIEVRDNGSGIATDDIPVFAKCHYTSKIKNHSDLESLASYGFRGEALASLCAVSEVTVTTKTADQDVGFTYTLSEKGDVKSTVPSHLGQGTTVCARNLFKNLPVRKQYHNMTKKKKEDLKNVETLLLAYGLILPTVRMSLRHNKELVWQKVVLPDTKAVMLSIFGKSVVGQMEWKTQELQDPEMKMELCVPKPGSDVTALSRSTPDRSFLCVNSRPVIVKEIDKLIRQYYSNCHACDMSRHPIYFVRVELPAKDVDVNLEPNKTTVMTTNMTVLREKIEEMLLYIYGPLDQAPSWRYKDADQQQSSSVPVPEQSELGQFQRTTDSANNSKSSSDVSTNAPNKHPSSDVVTATCALTSKEDGQQHSTDENKKQNSDKNGDIDANFDLGKDILDEMLGSYPTSVDDKTNDESADSQNLDGKRVSSTNSDVSGDQASKQETATVPQSTQDKNERTNTSVGIADTDMSKSNMSSMQEINHLPPAKPSTHLSEGHGSLKEVNLPPDTERIPQPVITSNKTSGSTENVSSVSKNDKSDENDPEQPSKTSAAASGGNVSEVSASGWSRGTSLVSATGVPVQPVQLLAPSPTHFPGKRPLSPSHQQQVEKQAAPPEKRQATGRRLCPAQSTLYDMINNVAVKRPLSAKDLFLKETRPKVVQDNPFSDYNEVTEILEKMWEELPDEQQIVFREKCWLDTQRYREEAAAAQNIAGKVKTATAKVKAAQMSVRDMVAASSTQPSPKALGKKKKPVTYVSECTISFSIDHLRNCVEKGSQPSMTHFPHPQVLACIPSCKACICGRDTGLSILNVHRLTETLIYHRLLHQHKLDTHHCQPVRLLPSNVGKHWPLLQKLAEDSLSLDLFADISDCRISHNGFRIKCWKDSEGSVCAELVGLCSTVPTYGLPDLLDVLELISSGGKSLAKTRPLKVIHYLKGEAVRMARQQTEDKSVQDIQELLEQASSFLPDSLTTCLHDRPFFYTLLQDIAAVGDANLGTDADCSEQGADYVGDGSQKGSGMSKMDSDDLKLPGSSKDTGSGDDFMCVDDLMDFE